MSLTLYPEYDRWMLELQHQSMVSALQFAAAEKLGVQNESMIAVQVEAWIEAAESKANASLVTRIHRCLLGVDGATH